MSQVTTQLLQFLADGKFYSGEQLGQTLNMSRMAVHKRINGLEKLGLDIYRVTGKGYRLATPLQLLEAPLIQQYLNTYFQQPQKIDYPAPRLLHVTGSTNDDLRTLMSQSNKDSQNKGLPKGTYLLAEMQTAGRGRRGKPWQSPFGCNLYLSMYWPLFEGVNAAMGLSVAIGVALAEGLTQAGLPEVEIKWPNDVYISGQKIAGILVELEVASEWQGEATALVGVGLNLQMPTEHPAIEQPYTCIQAYQTEKIDRNYWAAWLIHILYKALDDYAQQGIAPLIKSWRKFDRFYNQPVRILMGQHSHEGIACGIDESGALLVKQNGQVKRYFGGEVSVRG